MAIFSVTERATFRRCKRKAVLSSKNGEHLGPIFPPLSLSVGTIVHKAHQLWITNPTVPMSTHALEASTQAIASVSTAYTKQVGCAPSDAELLVTHEAIDTALKMCDNYAIRYGTPLPPDYKLLQAEQTIRAPVPGTEHACPYCYIEGLPKGFVERMIGLGAVEVNTCQNCNGTGTEVHYLEGRLDGLIQHSSGRIDVLERKTYGQRPRQEALQTNDQFLAYLWLVKQLGFNSDLGGCVAYDGMWRRETPPRGRTFDDLFVRYTLTRSPAELAEFERFLPLELNDMADLYAAPQTAYTNKQWQGCWDCQFSDKPNTGKPGLCTAVSRGEEALVAQIRQTQFTTRADDTEEQETETE